jgi:hypothetical protein
MRLSLMRPRNLTFFAAAALVAVLLANPASAEPSTGAATTPDLDLSEPWDLAGPK